MKIFPNSLNEMIFYRGLKKFFITGFVNILPTILVISILVIAYNFLNTHLGGPINVLIKKQLAGNWKDIAIRYLKVDQNFYETANHETYEQMVQRIQAGSVSLQQAKENLEFARKQFEEMAMEKIQKKASSNDPDYIKFLDLEIKKLREGSGLVEAEKAVNVELMEISEKLRTQNALRLEAIKWKKDIKNELLNEIERKYPNVIGLIFAFGIIFFIGLGITTFVGRSLKKFWEKALSSLPLVRKIYPYTKQLTEFLFKEKSTAEFDRVVAIEYPRKGLYAIGFPTGKGGFLSDKLKGTKELITLFIPSSPTPFTGYTILVEESNTIALDITVEEAIRFAVTGGVIKPNNLALEDVKAIQEKKEENSHDQHDDA